MEEFISLLSTLQKKLQPIFLRYLSIERELETRGVKRTSKEAILDSLDKGNFALVSANSSKKKLKSIGLNPQYLIVSGGPLFIEDYKKVDPNLPDNALPGIEKKCERLIKQLKDEKWDDKELYFIYETDNASDRLILDRLEEISKLIEKQIKTIEIKSWKDLNNQ